MKVTIDVGKLCKGVGFFTLMACAVYSLVYIFLMGIRILNTEPTCIGELCFSSAMDDPVLGWVCILMPSFLLLFVFFKLFISRDN